jgi:TFIIF, beta subunit HTH domain
MRHSARSLPAHTRTRARSVVKHSEPLLGHRHGDTDRHIFDIMLEDDRRKKQEAEALAAASASAAGDDGVLIAAGPGGRKVKADKGELKGMLFQLFARQQRWALKELQARLNQPDDHLKSVSAAETRAHVHACVHVCKCVCV